MQKSRLVAIGVAASMAALIGLTGCAGADSSGTTASGGTEASEIFIGGVWPMTGQAATSGQWSAIGAEIAADEVAADGGPKFKFRWEDSQLDTQLGVTALESLINDGAQAVLTGGSGVITAQGPTITRSGIPVLNNMAQSPLIAGLSPWLFNIIPPSTSELEGVAEIAKERGLKKIAFLTVDSDLGKGDVTVLSDLIKKQGGQIVANEAFPVGASDVRTAATRVRDADPDAIYLVGNVDELGNAIAQVRELGIDATILGRTPSLDPTALERAGEAAEGMVGTATVFRPSEDNQAAQQFIDEFRKRADSEPNVFAAVAYDAVKMLGAAYEELGSDASSEEVGEWLNSQSDFGGIMGDIAIKDNIAAYPLFKFEIKDGAVEPFEG